ncbi:hypothetical protein NDU88_006201 [Pleurodeles waltl]|uniref:Uncharacterized protein n=1 Tax=Pleurodeles waltl TaxID=8319 RepID=A0AAV7PHS4_PLEWA|nr:hypothetical protein NDU88_006201 [Pleurodeles waltl]
MPIGRLSTDGGRVASRGQEPATTAPLRLGQETRLWESGDLVQRLSHPVGPKMLNKNALSCLSAKTARLRGWARLQESADLVQRLSHPAGPKTLRKCPRLPQCKGSPTAGTGEAPGTWTPIDPQTSRAGLQGIN